MPDNKTPEQRLEEATKAAQDAAARIDEAVKKQEEMQAQLTNLSEENARLRGIVTEFGQPPARPPRKENIPDPVTQPEEFADYVRNKTIADQHKLQAQQEEAQRQARAIREAFYKKYPHLVKHQPLVAFFTNQVLSENPNLSQEAGFAEVAKRCEDYIKENLNPKTKTPPPPHVGSGGQPPAPEAPEGTPPEPQTAEQIAKDSVSDRRKTMDQKARPPA